MLNFFMLTAMAAVRLPRAIQGQLPRSRRRRVHLRLCRRRRMGLVISAFMRSQIAAIFATALLTLDPGHQYSGLDDPVSSLEGAGAFIGEIYPDRAFRHHHARHFLEGARFQAIYRARLAAADRHARCSSALAAVLLAETGALSMRFANIIHLGIKELRGLARDPMHARSWSPLPSRSRSTRRRRRMPETSTRRAIAIVDEDQSPALPRIITAFNPPYFAVPRLIVAMRRWMPAWMPASIRSR